MVKSVTNSSSFSQAIKERQQEFAQRLAEKKSLMDELERKTIKFNRDAIIDIIRNKKGKIIFLERGSENAGYKHILEHANDFAHKGISIYQLPHALFSALKNHPLGLQNPNHTKGGRPIYRYYWENVKHKKHPVDVAISVSKNGFIVGANPTSMLAKKYITSGQNPHQVSSGRRHTPKF